MEQEAVI
ncbi:hypothetical protein ECPA49_5701, partial [Escherichia coli PA49]